MVDVIDSNGQIPAVGAVPAKITPMADVPKPRPAVKSESGPDYKTLYEKQVILNLIAEKKLEEIKQYISSMHNLIGPLVDVSRINRILNDE